MFARNDTVVIDIAAASGATAAPPTVIQGTSSQRAPRRAAAAAASAKKAAPVKRSGVHTLSGPASQRGGRGRGRGSSSIKRTALGDGARLGDTLDDDDDGDDNAHTAHGSSAGTAEPPAKYQRTHAIHLSSKDAIAETLVNAVSHQSNDRSGKFFRAATKSALEHQYAMTLANARLNAALANRFEIHVVATAGRVGTKASESDAPKGVEMRVKFRESARKWHEETVEMLYDVELKAALQYVLLSGGETGKEMLKPFNMAQCSPRCVRSLSLVDRAAGERVAHTRESGWRQSLLEHCASVQWRRRCWTR